ncbi:hypothetical protein [Erwinia sp. 9145]|uniref:hypothetical protein n=1 Tax=Erwinia sp. 9145 TaxID=1500895 RepID=UPI00055595E8|nr:hypothetical protein [Erwinia sp. 9145]
MRELKSTEIEAVNGAGKIQDSLSDAIGSFFGNIFESFKPAAELGYTKEDFTGVGKDLGNRVGSFVENIFGGIVDKINEWIK